LLPWRIQSKTGEICTGTGDLPCRADTTRSSRQTRGDSSTTLRHSSNHQIKHGAEFVKRQLCGSGSSTDEVLPTRQLARSFTRQSPQSPPKQITRHCISQRFTEGKPDLGRQGPAVNCLNTPQCTGRDTNATVSKLIETCPTAQTPDQADSLTRPLARRFLRIARPARVDIRARKPCLRARRLLLGWNVLLLTGISFAEQLPLGNRSQDSQWRGMTARAAPKHDKARGGHRIAATRPASHTVVVYPQAWRGWGRYLLPSDPLSTQLLHILWINMWTKVVNVPRRCW
jgi:hypothetical protein